MIRDDSGTFRRSNAPQVKFLAPSYTFVIREHKIDDKILVENPSVSMISETNVERVVEQNFLVLKIHGSAYDWLVSEFLFDRRP